MCHEPYNSVCNHNYKNFFEETLNHWSWRLNEQSSTMKSCSQSWSYNLSPCSGLRHFIVSHLGYKKIRTIIYILNQDRWSWAPAQAKTIIWYFVCSVRSPACVCGGCGGGGRRGWGRPPRGLAVRRATPRGQMGPGPGGANAGVAARALRHRRAGGGARQPALLQDHTLHCGSCAR